MQKLAPLRIGQNVKEVLKSDIYRNLLHQSRPV